LTGHWLDKGLLGVWDRIDVTDMITDPGGWDLIATKRLTKADRPGGITLGYIITSGSIQDKSCRTETSHIRDGQEALLLGGFRCDADPTLLAWSWFDKGLLWVRDGIGITDMVIGPLRGDLIVGKSVTEAHLPMRLIL
jgi:hypothetical protein